MRPAPTEGQSLRRMPGGRPRQNNGCRERLPLVCGLRRTDPRRIQGPHGSLRRDDGAMWPKFGPFAGRGCSCGDNNTNPAVLTEQPGRIFPCVLTSRMPLASTAPASWTASPA
ncbi:hypothetical protein Rumeso_04972 [Rubellimicrobium mesophilum DSM 19309]|uniref:Uncharacterized protein n=1 Tax=Rubellimicrobium mesophilum DSM 19309 TaxID=442562 RepID=A0A017HB43_9RHOB|nr:hypothetical protein Rumeso_04972 [Rubellimicrobium mesophilum DSM 19309]